MTTQNVVTNAVLVSFAAVSRTFSFNALKDDAAKQKVFSETGCSFIVDEKGKTKREPETVFLNEFKASEELVKDVFLDAVFDAVKSEVLSVTSQNKIGEKIVLNEQEILALFEASQNSAGGKAAVKLSKESKENLLTLFSQWLVSKGFAEAVQALLLPILKFAASDARILKIIGASFDGQFIGYEARYAVALEKVVHNYLLPFVNDVQESLSDDQIAYITDTAENCETFVERMSKVTKPEIKAADELL